MAKPAVTATKLALKEKSKSKKSLDKISKDASKSLAKKKTKKPDIAEPSHSDHHHHHHHHHHKKSCKDKFLACCLCRPCRAKMTCCKRAKKAAKPPKEKAPRTGIIRLLCTVLASMCKCPPPTPTPDTLPFFQQLFRDAWAEEKIKRSEQWVSLKQRVARRVGPKMTAFLEGLTGSIWDPNGANARRRIIWRRRYICCGRKMRMRVEGRLDRLHQVEQGHGEELATRRVNADGLTAEEQKIVDDFEAEEKGGGVRPRGHWAWWKKCLCCCVVLLVLIVGAFAILVVIISEGKWSLVLEEAAWEARADHQVVYWDGAHADGDQSDAQFILVGGTNGAEVLNDVWRSTDGAGWTATKDAPWLPRRSFAMLYDHHERWLYVMGGDTLATSRTEKTCQTVICEFLLNDVWRSGDGGDNWSPRVMSAPWAARRSFSAVLAGAGHIFLVGGHYGVRGVAGINDVWETRDGALTWTLVSAVSPFSGRQHFGFARTGEGSMFILGGHDGQARNDVWFSFDGRKWYQQAFAPNVDSIEENEVLHAGWDVRLGHVAIAGKKGIGWGDSGDDEDDSVYIIGGVGTLDGEFGSEVGMTNDVWKVPPVRNNSGFWVRDEAVLALQDPAEWTRLTKNAGWTPRYGHACATRPDPEDDTENWVLWLFGGRDKDGFKSDVWNSEANFDPFNFQDIYSRTVSRTAEIRAEASDQTDPEEPV